MKCIEPKKQNIAEINKEEVLRVIFSMEDILKEKQRRKSIWLTHQIVVCKLYKVIKIMLSQSNLWVTILLDCIIHPYIKPVLAVLLRL